MIKQCVKQALRMIGESKLSNVISILGTALVICMIMAIVILYIVNTANLKPEINHGRTYYITTAVGNGKGDNRRISYSSLGLPLVKGCCYPLKGAEAVTAINMGHYRPLIASSMGRLKNQTSYISYTGTAFWKIFQFDFQQGGPFSPAVFTSGIRDAVTNESVALALFGMDQVVEREMKLDFIVYSICEVVKDVFRLASRAWAEVRIPYTVRDDRGYQEGTNDSYSCCVLLKPGVTRGELRIEMLRRVEEFNAKTRDVKADILHQPSTQIEEWIGGGSEFGASLFYLYVRHGIILFILLLVPALNLSGITLSRICRQMAGLGVRQAFGAIQDTISWQVLSENMVLTPLDGLLGLAMSYGAMLLLKGWLLVASLGKTGLSTGIFNGAVFVTTFLLCLVLNPLSADLSTWRISRLNITGSINGWRYV